MVYSDLSIKDYVPSKYSDVSALQVCDVVNSARSLPNLGHNSCCDLLTACKSLVSISQHSRRGNLSPAVPGVVVVGGEIVRGTGGHVGLWDRSWGLQVVKPKVVHVVPSQQQGSNLLHERPNFSCGSHLLSCRSESSNKS